MKLNNSAFKKLEYSSLEKDILFEDSALTKSNSFSLLNGESSRFSQRKSKYDLKKTDFLLESPQFIDVISFLFSLLI